MSELGVLFKAAVARVVTERTGDEVTEILGWDEEMQQGGYCETCWFEYAVVRVRYVAGGTKKTWQYSGNFAELLELLLKDQDVQ